MFAAMAAGEVEPLREIFAADVCWHYPRSFAALETRSADSTAADPDPFFSGRDALLATVGLAHRRTFRYTEQPEIVDLVVDGDSVALLARVRAVLHNGGSYENLYSLHLRFRDAQLIEAWELLDSSYAQSTFPPM